MKNEHCECEKDGFCPRYQKDVAGRIREICRGENVDPGTAVRYRQLWLGQAKQPVAVETKCPFLGEPVKDTSGENVKQACEPCGGKLRQLFACNHPSREPDQVTVGDCSACEYKPKTVEKAKAIILKNHLSPGDVTCMTGAIFSLHKAHPGKFLTAVETTCNAIFEHNPDVISIERARELNAEVVETHYPRIQRCNQEAIHFLNAYTDFFGDALGINVPLMTNRPHIYVSKRERSWMNQVHEATGKNQKYWVINAGVKKDFTAKIWPWYQDVVDRLQGKILFVQIGKTEHVHQPLRGVVNLLDKTDDRQLIRLVHHSQGVLCGTTFLMHLAAGLERPAVILAGGREPRSWNQYPIQSLLSTVGALPCCAKTACWRSRTTALMDQAEQDGSLCENPTFTNPPSPKCMAMISPEQACLTIQNYYN